MNTPLRRPGMIVASVAALLVLASSQSFAVTTARHVRVKEHRVPTKRAGLIGIASGWDGNVWFAETFAHKVGRITTRGVVTDEWNVPHHTTAWNMAAGPDGNVWFTTDDKYIGKVTREGVFTLYDVSGVAPGALTFDIAAGPDGNMWFTGLDGLGRITPNGQASVVPVPGASVWKVTGGPDGNIWFTDRTGKIGRVTPQGNVKEYDLPAGQTPDAITAGHDGNLWFTEDFNPSRVGRITPNGDITVFPFGAGGDRGLQDISPGVSDRVWVTETNVAAVGRVASDGSWKEFPLNFPRSNSFRITLGSDGRMWFTDESKNRVGRIVLQRPPP